MKYPTIQQKDLSDIYRLTEFINWFINEDPYVKGIRYPLLIDAFKQGVRPSVNSDLGSELDKFNFKHINDWFIMKMYISIKSLKDTSRENFNEYLGLLNDRSFCPIVTNGKILEKYNLDPNFVEWSKIEDENDKCLLLQSIMDEAINCAESHILSYLYYKLYNDKFSIEETLGKLNDTKVKYLDIQLLVQYFITRIPVIFNKEDIEVRWGSAINEFTFERHKMLSEHGLEYTYKGLEGQNNYAYIFKVNDFLHGEFSVDFTKTEDSIYSNNDSRLANVRIQLFHDKLDALIFVIYELIEKVKFILGDPIPEDTNIPSVKMIKDLNDMTDIWEFSTNDNNYYVSISLSQNVMFKNYISINISEIYSPYVSE